MLSLSHKNLEVYKIAMKLVSDIYRITQLFPKEEYYGLVSQIRRAAVSVVSNIAEGASRTSKIEKKRFYEVARGSVVEIDTQFEIASNLGYYKKDKETELNQGLESSFRMLSKMIQNLKSSEKSL